VITGDAIFDYMDGAGEIVKACGYRSLTVSHFMRPELGAVTVEQYDMGNPANAFGLYSMKRNPGGRVVELDHPAQLDTSGLLFWKGRYTFFVFPSDPESKVASQLLPLGKMIGRSVKDRGDPPDLLRYLPVEGYRPDSVKYFRGKAALDTVKFVQQDVLGLRQGAEVAAAVYRQPVAKALVARYAKEEAAVRALAACKRLPPSAGLQVIRQGRLLGAAWGTSQTAARQLLAKLERSLRQPGPPWKRA
jgi:hypothetical protein